MKKFKILGILLAVLMFFGVGTVYAKSMSSSDTKLLNKIVNGAKTKAQSLVEDIDVKAPVGSDGKTVNITVSSASMDLTVTFNVTLANNIVTYNGSSDSNVAVVLPYVVAAIMDNVNGVTTTSSSDAESLINSISNYSFSENGIEGTTSDGELTYLKVDAAKMKLAGGYSSSSSSSSDSSSSSTEPKAETTENPKTGVFVPVVGLSVLIVASVVCLIWISKKNVFKGF